MKQPIALFSNDWHLKKDNIDKIKDLVKQKCELASKAYKDELVKLNEENKYVI